MRSGSRRTGRTTAVDKPRDPVPARRDTEAKVDARGGKGDTMRQDVTAPPSSTPYPSPTLSARQRRAVEALLSTGEVSAAAQTVGVSRQTLYRWLAEPAFTAAVRSAEAQALDDLSRMLVRLGRTAAGTLARAMADPATPAATRVRAADAVLGRLLQLRELATLEARVGELERAAGLGEGGRAAHGQGEEVWS